MVNKEILQEIQEYCKLNEIEVSETLNKALRSGFTILKFGTAPNTPKSKEKVVEVVKEVEKIIEGEKIIEKIIEVPKIVEVDKIIKVSDDTKIDELLKDINNLENNNGRLTNEINRIKKENTELNDDLTKCRNENVRLSSGGFDMYGEK